MAAVNIHTGWRYEAGWVKNIRAGCTATASHYRYVSGLTETPLRIRQTDKEYICFSPQKSDRLQSLQDLNYNNISCHKRHGRELPTDSLKTIHTAPPVGFDLEKRPTWLHLLFLPYQMSFCFLFFFIRVGWVWPNGQNFLLIDFFFFFTNRGVLVWRCLMCWRAAPSLTV